MRIAAVDDEALALESLVKSIKNAAPHACVSAYGSVRELLESTKTNTFDVAFLDVEMRGTSGIELAERLKEINPEINIIFVTGHTEYMGDAFKLHASGYVLKPVTKKAILNELENLRRPAKTPNTKKLRVYTFSNFEVYAGEKQVEFTRNKSKEVFAYLIDRHGTSATFAEIAAIIWDDGLYDRSRQKQLQVYISDMMKALEASNVSDVIIKSRTGMLADASKIDCDMYRFLEGDEAAKKAFRGEYMSAYSWAEFTAGMLLAKTNM